MTFAEVRKMMYVATDDPRLWRAKRRRSVLGYMRELKISLFHMMHGDCAEAMAS